MAVRPLPERGCVIHPTLGLMYNLTGAQSGLSHGLPLCSETAWPALVSFLKQSIQLSASLLSPVCLFESFVVASVDVILSLCLSSQPL